MNQPAAIPVAIYVLTPQGARQALRVCAALWEQAQKDKEGTGNPSLATIPPVQTPETVPGVAFQPRSKAACLPPDCAGHVYVPESLSLAPDLAESGVFRTFSRLSSLVEETFLQYPSHIFIAATGIAVRTIAPLLEHKQSDPAVLVMDQKGQFIISLVSGHLGGANALTAKLAAALGATPVITTATDLENVPAIDTLAVMQGLVISNIAAVKKVSAALVAGKTVPLYDPDNWLDLAGSDQASHFQFLDMYPEDAKSLCIVVTTQTTALPDATKIDQMSLGQTLAAPLPCRLVLHPPALVAGIGCKRNTPAEDILKQLRYTFQRAGQSLASLCCLASVNVKQNEPGLFEAAKILGVPLRFFSLEKLRAFPVSAPSAKCEAEFSVKGVCEPAALAAAGDNAILVQPKTTGHMVTVAITQKKPGPFCAKLSRQNTPL